MRILYPAALALPFAAMIGGCTIKPAEEPAQAPANDAAAAGQAVPGPQVPSPAAPDDPPTAIDTAMGDDPQAANTSDGAADGASDAAGDAAPAPAPKVKEAALIRAQWAKADNRARCAPIGFGSDGGVGGTARRAEFGGGWAVAFDLPGRRSAYGVAGTGLVDGDRAGPRAQRERLRGQWPLFRPLDTLPAPAFAGYGLVGAKPYPSDNPDGRGVESLAYVRAGGQTCTYNVWSRLGRKHLETLLAGLRMLD